MLNYLSIRLKIKWNMPARPPAFGNTEYVDQSLWQTVPTLIAEIYIPLKYLSNFWR